MKALHDRETQLDNILADYLMAEETGHAPDRAALLQAYPEFAAELQAFFFGRAQLDDLAKPLQAIARAAQLAGDNETPIDQWATTPPANRPGEEDAAAGLPGQGPATEPPQPDPQSDPPTCDYLSTQDNADAEATQPPRPRDRNLDKATGRPSYQKTQAVLPVVPGYEILGVLGKGGMGVVYKARHLQLNRLVALKMIKAGAHADEDDIVRFRAEAEAVARLQHPNIVQIHEIGEHGGQPYFALEFCGGGSLDRKLRDAPLIASEGARLVETLAHALEHAHSQRVIHRDLKPANVLLGADGTPKVTDFGLAKKLDAVGLTQSGMAVGTPQYMAPEQAAGKVRELGPLVDVYALGALLYELLTSRPPFQGKTTLDTLHQVVNDEPVAPSRRKPGTPLDLCKICLKCLEKDPSRRYGSAAALAADLGRFLSGQPVEARHTPRWERALKWARRHPARAAVGALALLLTLVVVYSGAFWIANDAAQRLKDDEVKARQKENDEAKETIRLAKLQDEGMQREAYRKEVLLAAEACKNRDEPKARDHLEKCPEEFRNFEWHYLSNLVPPEIATLREKGKVLCTAFHRDRMLLCSGGEDKVVKLWDAATGVLQQPLIGHASPVTGLAFSPKDGLLASADQGGTIKLWDTATGRERFTFQVHGGPVRALVFIPGIKCLASASADKTVRLWNLATGKERAILGEHKAEIKHLCVSPDGSRLASVSEDKILRVWDTQSGEEVIFEGHTGAVHFVAFSPDGLQLAACVDKTIKLWDLKPGKATFTSLKDHTDKVNHVAYSPDGLLLASASDDDKVILWHLDTGAKVATLEGHKQSVEQVVFNPIFRQLVSADIEGKIIVWNCRNFRKVATLAGHTDALAQLAYSADGLQLASLGLVDGTVKLWHGLAGKANAILADHKKPVTRVVRSPDGQWLASASGDKTIIVWDAATGQKIRKLVGHIGAVTQVCFSPDSNLLASASVDRTIKLWNRVTGLETATLERHPIGVMDVCFRPGTHRQQLAWANLDGTVKVCDVRTGEAKPLSGHSDAAVRVAYRPPDGNALASAGRDAKVIVWDPNSGNRIFTLSHEREKVIVLAYSPDGRQLATAGADKKVYLWNAATGELLTVFDGHGEAINHVAFSSDGKLLASASNDKFVKLWDATTYRLIETLRGHASAVLNVAFSPDGQRLASASYDGAIKLWDTQTAKEVATLDGHDNKAVFQLSFSSDSKQLASAGADGTVVLWYGKLDQEAWMKRREAVAKW